MSRGCVHTEVATPLDRAMKYEKGRISEIRYANYLLSRGAGGARTRDQRIMRTSVPRTSKSSWIARRSNLAANPLVFDPFHFKRCPSSRPHSECRKVGRHAKFR